jgi:hypothetical protein
MKFKTISAPTDEQQCQELGRKSNEESPEPAKRRWDFFLLRVYTAPGQSPCTSHTQVTQTVGCSIVQSTRE